MGRRGAGFSLRSPLAGAVHREQKTVTVLRTGRLPEKQEKVRYHWHCVTVFFLACKEAPESGGKREKMDLTGLAQILRRCRTRKVGPPDAERPPAGPA